MPTAEKAKDTRARSKAISIFSAARAAQESAAAPGSAPNPDQDDRDESEETDDPLPSSVVSPGMMAWIMVRSALSQR